MATYIPNWNVINIHFIITITDVYSVFNYYLMIPSCTRNSHKIPHNKLMRKVWGNAMKSYQCEFSWKNSYHYDSICGNPFLMRKIRGIGPIPREEYFSRGIFLARNIPREEYSSPGFRPNPRTNIFLTRNEKLTRNIPREEYSSREIISRGF